MVNDHFQIVFSESKQGQAFWFVEIVYVLTMPIVDDHGKEFYAYMLVYVDDINHVTVPDTKLIVATDPTFWHF